MTLPVPRLDTRTYDDLLAEALRRLPLYTPEYTNHNASDPGRAILEANAFLTETLLYQINRVPDQNHIAFLNLIGLKPLPARPARADLAFQLKDLKRPGDPLLVDVPLGTQVAVDDPDLAEEVIFETDRSLRALNAAVGIALVPQGNASDLWQAVTRFDSEGGRETEWLHAFHPFGENESVGNQCIIGFVLRPKADIETPEDRMPSGPLDVYVETTQVFDMGTQGETLLGPLATSSGTLSAELGNTPLIKWEVFTGGESGLFSLNNRSGWSPLNSTLDETDGLKRSGIITFEIPSTVTGVRLGAASVDAWSAMGKRRSPRTKEELIAYLNHEIEGVSEEDAEQLKQAMTQDVLTMMGVTHDGAIDGCLSDCSSAKDLADTLSKIESDVNPSAISQEVWASLVSAFAAPNIPTVNDPNTDEPRYLPLYFIRATLEHPEPVPRLLNRLRINVVKATAASSRKDERLGVSNGRPGQRFRLSRYPVAIHTTTGNPDLDLTVTLNGETVHWQQVTDFHGFGPAEKVYVLDPLKGEIQFGDGRAKGIGGAIPPNNAVIRAAHYRFGGGRVANVAQDSITKIKGALTHVKSVSNPRPALGGSDAETLEEVRRRAPSALRRRERAVSAQDFADLAKETPGAAIHSAYAIAAKAPTTDGFVNRAGAVSVVVLPDIDHPTPQPNAATLAAVQAWLNPRRLVTTELHVLGPRYFMITHLHARLTVSADADFSKVAETARLALTNWLHPIRGGREGKGWPFGADIYHADIYSVLLNVPGIKRVSGLQLAHDGEPRLDVVPIPEGLLPALHAGAIGFEVGYE